MREPLSVLVPTWNEAANIRACLESVRWAEEVVVVDSGSSDGTVDLARPVADRILIHEYVNSASQKNWALPQLSHRWVLIVDADERVPPRLKAEIEAVLADPGRADGYWIYRANHFLGASIRTSGWQRDRVLRLFDRTRGAYEPLHVHAEVAVRGRVGSLRERLIHHTYRDLDHYFGKFLRYTKWSAEDLKRRGIRGTSIRLLLRPSLRFWRMYLLEGGWREGRHGIVLAGLAAFSVFTKYARRWEDELGRSGAETREDAGPDPAPTSEAGRGTGRNA